MINKPYPFIILGLTVIISNVLGLVASILVYFYKPTLFEENLWGSIIVVCFLYNFFAIIISRKYWLHTPGEQQIKFAPIKGMAIIYLLYSFLGFLSVQALLQWPIIGIGGFNLIFIFGIGFGFSILLFPINRVPKKIYSWLLKRRVFGRRVLRAIVAVFVAFYSLIIFLRLSESQHLITYMLSYIISMNVVTIALWTLTIDTFSVWLVPSTWSKTKKILYACLCIFITMLSFAPTYRVLTAPTAINQQFEQAFGPNWNTPTPATQSYFLSSTASVSGIFYGPNYFSRANNCIWEKDLLFHNETKYQLYYDVFYPKIPVPSIGNNATILYILGGGYMGGKRSSSQIHCKYLASQGYVVFAFDYRVVDINKLAISDESKLPISFLPVNPSYKTGNYTLKDMIHDIGEFTQYLATRPNHYGADYSRVFIYGESSGGHLASIAAYGWNNPWYAGNFSTSLTPKAVILFYPPIIAAEMFYYSHPLYTENHQIIPGTPETNPEYFYATPSYLVNNESVPCLIFHGTADEIVPVHHSDALRKQMELFNRTCIQVKFGSIGHGFTHDYQFQYLCLYYMERFLRLV